MNGNCLVIDPNQHTPPLGRLRVKLATPNWLPSTLIRSLPIEYLAHKPLAIGTIRPQPKPNTQLTQIRVIIECAKK